MPCLRIFTNVPSKEIPKDFAEKVIPILARTVGKPAQKFICMITGDCSLYFQGDGKNRCAVGTLESIGHIDPVRNKAVMKEVTAYITETIDIAPEKLFITFYDLKKSDVGISGTTVDELE